MNDEEYKVFPSKKGKPTLKYKDTFVLSQYDPEKEASKIVNAFVTENVNPSIVIVFGLGLGYHIKELNRKLVSTKIIVIERSEYVLQQVKEHDLVATSTFNLFVNRNIDILGKWIDTIINEEEAEKISFFYLKTLFEIDKEYYLSCISIIEEEIRKKLQNSLTTTGFGRQWHYNILRNIYHSIELFKNTNIFYEKYDVPVIITGSGPTLDYDILNIKKFSEHYLIITPAQSLPTLLHHNIIPDIVVSMDGGYHNRKYFENINDDRLNKTILITTLMVYPQILRMWKGKIQLVNMNQPLERFLLAGFSFEDFYMEGTVSLLALSVAKKLTTSSIILCGLDFCYVDNRLHSSGNPNDLKYYYSSCKTKNVETIYSKIVYHKNNRTIKLRNNTTVKTNTPFYSYYNHLKTVWQGDRRIINCSNKGLLGQNNISYKLSNALKTFSSTRLKNLDFKFDNLKNEKQKFLYRITRLKKCYESLLQLNIDHKGKQQVEMIRTFVKKGDEEGDIIKYHLGKILRQLRQKELEEVRSQMNWEIRKTIDFLIAIQKRFRE